MAADDYVYPMMGPSTRPRSSETPILSHPALQRRSALRDRRPRAVRRHTGRVATRFAVLVTGDLLAILLSRAAVAWFMADTSWAPIAFAGSPLALGGSRFVFVTILALVAVFATGGHSRHRALNQPVRLFVAAAGVVLINWAGGIARGYLSDLLLPMISTAATLWIALLLVRLFSEWFLRDVWPGHRGAGAAILVGNPKVAGRFGHAVGAPGGDYHVVGYASTNDNAGDGFLGTVDDLSALIDGYDAEAVVICADLPATKINEIIEECLHSGCQILYPARAVRVYGLRPTLVWHHDQPFFELGSPVLKARALISKRIVDVTFLSLIHI